MNNSLKNSHIPGNSIQTNYKFTFIVHKYISYLMCIYTYRYIYTYIFLLSLVEAVYPRVDVHQVYNKEARTTLSKSL